MTDSTDFGADLCAVTRKSDETGVTVVIRGNDEGVVKDLAEEQILAEQADGYDLWGRETSGSFINRDLDMEIVETLAFVRRDSE